MCVSIIYSSNISIKNDINVSENKIVAKTPMLKLEN